MPDPRKIAIFAENEGVRHFLAELVRQLGYEVATEEENLPRLGQRGTKLEIYGAGQAESQVFNLPQKPAVLLEAILKRVEKQAGRQREINFGAYTLDTYDHHLTGNGQETRLTEKESAILVCLYKAKGGIVGRQLLLDEVWGYAQNVETHTLETHIYRLRQKIEEDPSNPQILKTEEDGYSLIL